METYAGLALDVLKTAKLEGGLSDVGGKNREGKLDKTILKKLLEKGVTTKTKWRISRFREAYTKDMVAGFLDGRLRVIILHEGKDFAVWFRNDARQWILLMSPLNQVRTIKGLQGFLSTSELSKNEFDSYVWKTPEEDSLRTIKPKYNPKRRREETEEDKKVIPIKIFKKALTNLLSKYKEQIKSDLSKSFDSAFDEALDEVTKERSKDYDSIKLDKFREFRNFASNLEYYISNAVQSTTSWRGDEGTIGWKEAKYKFGELAKTLKGLKKSF